MLINSISRSRSLIGTAIIALTLVLPSYSPGNPLDQLHPLNNKPTQNINMNEQQERFADNSITPFEIAVSDEELQDLQARLARTRLPDQLDGISWEYDTDLDYMREILAYWQDGFDWREQERQLNQFDQFKTEIDGLRMHFIHQRSNNPDAIPLMVVHGWPGSVSEFMKIIDPLTDPLAYGGDVSDSFHVIAPSLPGFGFSEAPSERGFSPERIALVLANLMERLGYERYAIAGGDWGAIINRHLANHYPDRLIGMHSNMILAGPPADEEQRANVTDAENEARRARQAYMANEVAYQQIQGTKPQTLGYGLADSPLGTAAWIIEKFHGWSDMPQGADGYLDNHFTKDELLTNVSIYWFTNTITSSTRIYYENRSTPAQKPMEFINVPTGAAIFPAEIFIVPRAWAEAEYDLRHWTVMEEGGHFAALEKPELYINDVREFFRLLR